MKRVLAIVSLLLLLGCEELGNPPSSTGPGEWTEWGDADFALRTRIETFRVNDVRVFLARFPPGSVHFVEPTIRSGGLAGLVTVEIVRAKWMAFGPMQTDIQLETGQVVTKRWMPPSARPPWRLLVDLPAGSRAAVTRMR